MSSPLLIPPWTPPELFVVVRIFRRVFRMHRCAANPASVSRWFLEPISSNAFAAGMLRIAFARSASSLSNTGSPSPGGMPRATPFDHTADGIAFVANRLDERNHFFRNRVVRTADDVFFYVFDSQRSNGRSARQALRLALRKRRLRSSCTTQPIFFLQWHQPRRDQSFREQTHDLRPASCGFRTWLRKCSRRATVEICVRFRCSLRVERLCSEREPRSGCRVFSLRKRRTKFRSDLLLSAASSICFGRDDVIELALNFRFGKFRCAAGNHR